MHSMPRKSRFDLIQPGATRPRLALSPVARLTQPELNLFNLTVTQNVHLKPRDALLLTLYVQAAARLLRGSKDAAGDREKATRTVIALARSLRLTAHSLTDARTTARQHKNAHEPSPIDQFFADNPDDNDDDSDTDA
jgi:hypothetical protein